LLFYCCFVIIKKSLHSKQLLTKNTILGFLRYLFSLTLSEFKNFLRCERILINVTTNFKDFKRFGAFKGFVEQKNVVFNSFVSKLGLFGTRGPLKRLFDSRLAHSCVVPKKPNLHTNSLNKLLLNT
jgi:hypothetical protein